MGSQKDTGRGLEELGKIGERKSLGQHVFENLKERHRQR